MRENRTAIAWIKETEIKIQSNWKKIRKTGITKNYYWRKTLQCVAHAHDFKSIHFQMLGKTLEEVKGEREKKTPNPIGIGFGIGSVFPSISEMKSTPINKYLHCVRACVLQPNETYSHQTNVNGILNLHLNFKKETIAHALEHNNGSFFFVGELNGKWSEYRNHYGAAQEGTRALQMCIRCSESIYDQINFNNDTI